MTLGLNLGEVEAFTFPGEDDIGRATTFSNAAYLSEPEKDSNGYAFPDDVISRRQVQVKSTIKRAVARLGSVPDYPKRRLPVDPQLAILVDVR